MKLLLYILSIVCIVMIASCNDDVFIKDLNVEPIAMSIDWANSKATFSANQPIDRAYIIAYRWENGRGKPLANDGMSYSIDKIDGYESGHHITSELCNIELLLKNNKLTVNNIYNWYADTVYMHIDLSNKYETKQTNLRIMPSPGFIHGPTNYNLNQWYNEEHSDTIELMSLSNINNIAVTVNPLAAGDTIATKTGRFAPWNELLSDNIFGRKPFKVPGINFSPKTFDAVVSTDSITYNTSIHQLSGDAIICKENVSVSVPPMSHCTVSMIVQREEAGFSYEIPAYDPLSPNDAPQRIVNGLYWIDYPVSYEIKTEISSLVHP